MLPSGHHPPIRQSCLRRASFVAWGSELIELVAQKLMLPFEHRRPFESGYRIRLGLGAPSQPRLS